MASKIIEEIKAPYQAEQHRVNELNQNTDKLENIVSSPLHILRCCTRLLFFAAVTMSITGYFSYPYFDAKNQYRIARENIKVGNYDTAHEIISGIDDLAEEEFKKVFTDIVDKGLNPEEARRYTKFHNPHLLEEDLEIHQLEFENDTISTGLGKLTTKSGKDFLVLGDESGEIYFFNEAGNNLRTLMSHEICGKFHQVEENDETTLLIGTNDGLVYKIGLMELGEDKATIPVVKTIFDAKEKISELKSYDIDGRTGYFFTSETGEVFGIWADGTKFLNLNVFPTSEDSDEKKLDHLIPPVVTTDGKLAGLKGLVYDNEHLLIFDSDGKTEVIGDYRIIGELMKGDVNGDGIEENIFRTKHRIGIEKDSLYGTIEPNHGINISFPRYRGFVGDIDRDGFDDFVYGWSCGLSANLGSRNNPLKEGWDFDSPHTGFDCDYFTSNIILTDINGDGRQELIAGSDEGRIYVLKPSTGEALLKLEFGSRIQGDKIKHTNINGKSYLTFATEEKAYMIETGWFKALL